MRCTQCGCKLRQGNKKKVCSPCHAARRVALVKRKLERLGKKRMKIRTKDQNLKLWKQGRFGNTLRVWDTVRDALEDSSYKGPYVVRSRQIGGCCQYEGLNTRADLYNHYKLREFEEGLYVNEKMPEHLITLQGEVWQSFGGLYLHFSDKKGHMRECLKTAPKHAERLVAHQIILRALPDHAEFIFSLLEEFPDHVVEFSAFLKGIGDRGWPLIVWEVRTY